MYENKYGISNSSNEIIVNPEYEYLKYAFGSYYIISKNGKFGIISDDGQIKLELNYLM